MMSQALTEQELFDFICRKYVQRSDERQKQMGLQYTTAGTRDLASTIFEFVAYRSHVLYRTRDKDAPESIKDRNGDVVLSLCRVCGRGEIELAEICSAPREPEVSDDLDFL